MGNIAKVSSSREVVKAELQTMLGEEFFLRDSEEFDGREGAIWTSGESSASGLNGEFIASFYGMKIHPKVEELLNKHGWWLDWYDAGTILLYPDFPIED